MRLSGLRPTARTFPTSRDCAIARDWRFISNQLPSLNPVMHLTFVTGDAAHSYSFGPESLIERLDSSQLLAIRWRQQVRRGEEVANVLFCRHQSILCPIRLGHIRVGIDFLATVKLDLHNHPIVVLRVAFESVE